MRENVEESIVVLASEPSDRRLIDELLFAAGLREEGCEEGRREAAGDARGSATPTTIRAASPRHATIVCHRVSSTAPRPQLPDTAEGAGRLVVFSDCTSESAVVETLEAGAHHYFDIAESRAVMEARLWAALRTCSRRAERELLVPPFRFDLGKRRVWRDGRLVALSPKEFDLAYYLFAQRGRTVGNGELMTAVWSLPRTMDTRRIDTAACRIRKKMRLESPDEHWRLRRLRGEGYLLVPASDDLP